MRDDEACRTIEPSTGISGSYAGFPEEYSARPLNISLSSFIDDWIQLHPAQKLGMVLMNFPPTILFFISPEPK